MTKRWLLVVLMASLPLVGAPSANAEGDPVGSWAVVDANGNVINVAACQASFCGASGVTGGNVPGCDGCRYVEQKPDANGTAAGMTQSDKTVTYDSNTGEFNTTYKFDPTTPPLPPEEQAARALEIAQAQQTAVVPTKVPPAEQVGSWAVVDSNGKVINAIACQEIVCGVSGAFKGVTNSMPGCELGCQLVLQAAPNPVTGQSVGGWTSSDDVSVTYKDGAFNIVRRTIAPGTTVRDAKYETTLEVLKDGISTRSDGTVYDYVNQKTLVVGNPVLVMPAKVFGSELDAGTPIEQVFADAISAGTIAIKKSKNGYLFDTNWDTSKTDSKITLIATKKGAANRKITLVLNDDGDLVLNTKLNLKGYQMSIKVDGKIAAKIAIKN